MGDSFNKDEFFGFTLVDILIFLFEAYYSSFFVTAQSASPLYVGVQHVITARLVCYFYRFGLLFLPRFMIV
jgi:hypothetical protein